MSIYHRSALPFMRDQMGSFDDLDLSRCEAVDDLWAEFGLDAARCFLFGA